LLERFVVRSYLRGSSAALGSPFPTPPNSPIFQAMPAITPAQVQYLSLAYFGRPADPASLTAWPATGLSYEAVVLRLVASDEYKLNTIARNTSGNTLDQTGLINTYYQRLFGRLAAASEVAGWTAALANGAVNIDYLGITILNAGLNLPNGTDIKNVLIAKFDSSQLYTGILYNNPASAAAYNGAAAIANGTTFLNTVTTSTPATFVQAQTAVAALPSGGGSGQTITLTTNQFNYLGGPGNDTFVGIVGAVATFSPIDTIDGGLGTDTLRVVLDGLDYNGGATITNVEQLSLTSTGGGVRTFSAAGIAGLTRVEGIGNTVGNNLTVTGIGSAADLAATNTTANTTFVYTNAALAGAADVVTLNLSGVTGGIINADTATAGANGIETLNIVSILPDPTVPNTTTIATNAATPARIAINAAGATNLTLAAANNINTTAVVDASASTGAVTVRGFGVANQSITGGTGADTFLLGANLTTADTLNGGAGIDTFGANTGQLAAFAAPATNITNFETIQLQDDVAGTVNAAFFTGVVNARFGVAVGANLQTINGLASGANVRFDAGATNALNTVINIKDATVPGTADTLNIDARGAGAAVGLTASGVETVTLNLNNSTAAKTLTLIDPNLTTFNLTNTSANAFAYVLDPASTAVNTINLSGNTGTGATSIVAQPGGVAISYTGSGNADTFVATNSTDVINSGAGNDTITARAGVDQITGGAGSDTFIQTTGAASTAVAGSGIEFAAGVDRITDFTGGAGGDILQGPAALTTATIQTGLGVGAGTYLFQGTFASGTFTVNNSGADLLYGTSVGATVTGVNNNAIVLSGGFANFNSAINFA
jgi:hypothetical protein